MDPVDNIEVPLSEETGIEPVEAPKETTEIETPAEVETVPTAEPKEPELIELPDGRKLDAEGVAQEYKNLLSDYTKKSQTLAEIEKGKTINQPAEKPYQDPEWQPQTYDELLKAAEDRVFQALQDREKEKADQQLAVENAVVSQLTELKAIDPNLNENTLFLHATKYGFRDLKMAHQNMKDMSDMAKKVQSTTAANIAKRNDPVSVSPGATGSRPDPSQFENARDYLRSLK